MDSCACCGRPLTRDEVALTRKMVNRAARTFYCIACLAAHFEVPEDALREKIAQLFVIDPAVVFRYFKKCHDKFLSV